MCGSPIPQPVASHWGGGRDELCVEIQSRSQLQATVFCFPSDCTISGEKHQLHGCFPPSIYSNINFLFFYFCCVKQKQQRKVPFWQFPRSPDNAPCRIIKSFPGRRRTSSASQAALEAELHRRLSGAPGWIPEEGEYDGIGKGEEWDGVRDSRLCSLSVSSVKACCHSE